MSSDIEFIEACKAGDLDSIKEIYRLNSTINISANNEEAFRWACRYGHLEVVRQLYQWKSTIDISAKDVYAFRLACQKGHLEVVRQLYQWKTTIDIRRFYQYKSLFLSLGIFSGLQKEYIPEGETLECPICRDNIHGECMVTKCGHKYCANCINQWLENNNICPYCRTKI